MNWRRGSSRVEGHSSLPSWTQQVLPNDDQSTILGQIRADAVWPVLPNLAGAACVPLFLLWFSWIPKSVYDAGWISCFLFWSFSVSCRLFLLWLVSIWILPLCSYPCWGYSCNSPFTCGKESCHCCKESCSICNSGNYCPGDNQRHSCSPGQWALFAGRMANLSTLPRWAVDSKLEKQRLPALPSRNVLEIEGD